MNQVLVDKIVNAVLYEGYILYPYRPSVKNRQRWTFGSLYPRSCGEAWAMQTECLVQGGEHTTLQVKVRFLHLLARLVDTWQEAVEREHLLGGLELGALVAEPRRSEFAFPARREREPAREQQAVAGMIEVSANPV